MGWGGSHFRHPAISLFLLTSEEGDSTPDRSLCAIEELLKDLNTACCRKSFHADRLRGISMLAEVGLVISPEKQIWVFSTQ